MALKMVIATIPMPAANTDYPAAIPVGTKHLRVHTRDGTAFKIATEPNKAGPAQPPYWTVQANDEWVQGSLEGVTELVQIYVACGSAGKFVEAIFWVEEP